MTDRERTDTRSSERDSRLSLFHDALTGNSKETSSFLDLGIKLTLLSWVQGILDSINPGSPIVSATQHLTDGFRLSNRVVSFVLDGKTHYGTGVLVGPKHVLTASHLWFDEDGELIDDSRIHRTTVVVNTTRLGNVLAKEQSSTSLDGSDAAGVLIDPCLNGIIPRRRNVAQIDFAIVRIRDPLGNDSVGNGETRHWVELPTADTAPVVTPEMPVRAFQYIDAKEPRLSAGFVRGFTADGLRALHTASTIGGSSGSPVLNQKDELVGLHVSGMISGEFPKSNRALPIGLIADVIDKVQNGITIRSLLK